MSSVTDYLFKNYQKSNKAEAPCGAIIVAAYFGGRIDSSSFNRYSSDVLFLLHTEASNEPLMLCQTLNSALGNAAVAEKN
jgi:hypothetical protein